MSYIERNKDLMKPFHPQMPEMPVVPAPDKLVTSTGPAQGFVSDRFSVSSTLAGNLYDYALKLLGELGKLEHLPESVLPKCINLEPLQTFLRPPPPPGINVPDIEIAPLDSVKVPLFDEVPRIILDELPSFNVPDPSINIPSPPDVDWPRLTATEPVEGTIPIPSNPEVNLRPLPIFQPIVIPTAPALNIPTFDAQPPFDYLTPPEPMFVWHELPYNSELINQLGSEIYKEIVSGSTGLSADVEEAIWQRAIGRLREDDEKAFDEATNYFASRGWSMPVGLLNGSILETRNQINRRNLDLNRDILVQSSELAQKNRHFIFAQGVALEQVLMGYTNDMNNRGFEAAKFTASFAIEAHKLRVDVFLAKMESYKSMAQVYESRIRAELAKAEIYKAQIEGTRLEVAVQQHLVEVYKAQIGAVQAMMEMYRIQMQGAEIASNIERNKVDIFKAHVDAYTARIGANVSRFQAYQAQLAGESTKADVYGKRVDAWTSQVQGYKAKSDVQLAHLQSFVERNKDLVARYVGEIEGYKADIQHSVAEVDSKTKIEGLRTQVYGELVRKYGVDVDASVKEYLGNIQQVGNMVQLFVGYANANASTLNGYYDTLNRSKQVAAQVAGQLGAAALNSVSATASVGYTESKSDSTSDSRSQSAQWSQSANWSRSGQTSDSFTTSQSEAFGEYHNYSFSG